MTGGWRVRGVWTAALLLACSLAGCSGSDISIPSGDGPQPGPAGYYAGSMTSEVSGVTKEAVLLVADDGSLRIIDKGYDTQFTATLPDGASDLHIPLRGYIGLHATLPGPVTRCSGSLDAVLIAAAELDGSYSCGGDHGTLSFSFDDAISFDPPLPAALTGLLQGEPRPADILVLTVAPDGSYSGSDTFGCAYGGHFTASDPVIGVYAMDMRVDCGAGARSLSGLAVAVDPGQAGSALYYGVSHGKDALSGTLVFQ